MGSFWCIIYHIHNQVQGVQGGVWAHFRGLGFTVFVPKCTQAWCVCCRTSGDSALVLRGATAAAGTLDGGAPAAGGSVGTSLAFEKSLCSCGCWRWMRRNPRNISLWRSWMKIPSLSWRSPCSGSPISKHGLPGLGVLLSGVGERTKVVESLQQRSTTRKKRMSSEKKSTS